MPETPSDESASPEETASADKTPDVESSATEETATPEESPAAQTAFLDEPAPVQQDDGALANGLVFSIVALVIAVVAAGLGGYALFRQMQSSDDGEAAELVEVTPEFSEMQRNEAKSKVCSAFNLVRQGVTINTNQPNPGGPEDVTGALAVAANARVSLYDGGQYLLARIDPATPPELSEAVGRFGDLLLDIGASATAGVTNSDPDQAARLREADGLNKTVVSLCG